MLETHAGFDLGIAANTPCEMSQIRITEISNRDMSLFRAADRFGGLLNVRFDRDRRCTFEGAFFRSRVPGSSMKSFDSDRASRDRDSAWGNTPAVARAHPSVASSLGRESCR